MPVSPKCWVLSAERDLPPNTGLPPFAALLCTLLIVTATSQHSAPSTQHYVSVTPSASATVPMSLSPRPERQTAIMASVGIVGAIFAAWAIAWDDSSAGMIP